MIYTGKIAYLKNKQPQLLYYIDKIKNLENPKDIKSFALKGDSVLIFLSEPILVNTQFTNDRVSRDYVFIKVLAKNNIYNIFFNENKFEFII